MGNRRQFLASTGGAILLSTAGCTEAGLSEDGNPTTSTEETPDKKFPLPADPVSMNEEHLPLHQITTSLETSSIGFNSEDGEADFDDSKTSTDNDPPLTRLWISGAHRGTGKASGFASGSFQTAWSAPSTGQYRLTVFYHRAGDIRYDHPENGDISTSFNTSLLAIRHRDSEVLSKDIHPELRHKNEEIREELAEFMIETALTALIGNALALGRIGRFFLGQVIDHLIELDDYDGGGGSQIYDVAHQIKRNQKRPRTLSTTFEAAAGETIVFEFSPTLAVGYEIEDSWWFQPTLFAHTEFVSFYVAPV